MEQGKLFDIEPINQEEESQNTFDWAAEFPKLCDDNGNFEGFDVVIGNPPYISSKEIRDKRGLENFQTATKQFDLFSLFIERAFQITKQNGINSLIIPDSFLGRDSFAPIRKFIYENANLYKIIQLDNVFSEANVSSCIYFLQKSSDKSKIEFWKVPGQKIDEQNAKIKHVDFLTDKVLNSYRIVFTDNQEINLIKKIFYHIPLSEISISWRGEEIGKKSTKLRKKHQKNFIKILSGENIQRYNIKGQINFIEEKNILKTIDKYQQQKIVLRQLGNSINATISEAVTLQSVYCIVSTNNKYSNFLILGLLNSGYLNFVYKNYIAEKQTFPRVLLHNIRKLTIPEITPENQPTISQIETLVNEIIEKKETDNNADISAQSAQIDRLVYRLYNLNAEEIKMIENGIQ